MGERPPRESLASQRLSRTVRGFGGTEDTICSAAKVRLVDGSSDEVAEQAKRERATAVTSERASEQPNQVVLDEGKRNERGPKGSEQESQEPARVRESRS